MNTITDNTDNTNEKTFVKYKSIKYDTKETLIKFRFELQLPEEGEITTHDENLNWISKNSILKVEPDAGLDYGKMESLTHEMENNRETLNGSDIDLLRAFTKYMDYTRQVVERMLIIWKRIIRLLKSVVCQIERQVDTKTEFSNDKLIHTFTGFVETFITEFKDHSIIKTRYEWLRILIALVDTPTLEFTKMPTPEPIPEPIPEPPKAKEAKPSKQSQTRSANKVRDQKKREHEEYLRRVAEAEKAKEEAEKRKRQAKKANKKI